MIILPEKPIPPKKEKIGFAPIIIAIVLSFVTSFFIVSYCKNRKALELYNSDLAEYNQRVENHGKELNKYKAEVLSYIRSIDPSYDIDDYGTIPIEATVNIKKDERSQYIGDEMSYYFYINNNSVKYDSSFRLNIFREVIFETEIIENDPSSDDVGRKKDSIPLSFLEINDGYKIVQEVKVRENYGTKAGNVAIYHVTYTIKPQKYLYFSASQKNTFPQYPVLPNEPNKKDYSISFWDAIKNYSDIQLYIGIAFVFWALCSYLSLVRAPQVRYKRALDKYNKANDAYTSAKNDLIKELSGKSIRQLARVPDYVFFTNDDLPFTKNDNSKYGIFTLYITSSGSRFHKDKACSKSAFPVHMYKVPQRYTPVLNVQKTSKSRSQLGILII